MRAISPRVEAVGDPLITGVGLQVYRVPQTMPGGGAPAATCAVDKADYTIKFRQCHATGVSQQQTAKAVIAGLMAEEPEAMNAGGGASETHPDRDPLGIMPEFLHLVHALKTAAQNLMIIPDYLFAGNGIIPHDLLSAIFVRQASALTRRGRRSGAETNLSAPCGVRASFTTTEISIHGVEGGPLS